MSQMVGGCDALMPNIQRIGDEDTSNLYQAAGNFNYRMRRLQGEWEQGYYYSWPSSRTCCGDPSVGGYILGEDAGQIGGWDVPDYGWGGSIIPYFINGQTLASNGAVLTGVLVEGFLTSNNMFVGSVFSNSLGNYTLPTIFASNTHYLIAYMSGSPDIAGTTVNTLVPGITPG